MTELLEQLMQIARVSALEEMASGFAHEINQPIGAITTFAQAAERMLNRPEPAVAPAREVLQHISQQALGAGSGIRRIRDLFNRAADTRTVCEMGKVIDELIPVLTLLAERASIDLETHIAESLPAVSIDRLRIQHVIFTLVQNAIEAPRAEGALARVRLEATGDRYGVTTSVTDWGSGIGAGKDNLFRPFYTTKANGTGLGLASSRAIVEAHEGSIGAEDAPNAGARFWFHLPTAA
jgi:C4-dicarboxylate-specific signal transduction histidine kinase